ncbi:MAG: hypothetical protein EZS28_016542, partial [Streblomastix strix]
SDGNYYGNMGTSYTDRENVFYITTLYIGSKVVKIYYPPKFIIAWKIATEDSFMCGYNSSKMGAKTNIQVPLQENLTQRIVDTKLIKFTSSGFTFDDAPDPQILNFEIIGVIRGTMANNTVGTQVTTHARRHEVEITNIVDR